MSASDPAELARFYEQVWGLAVTAEHDGAYHLRGTGDEHHILVIEQADRSRLVGYELGLPDRDAVEDAARRFDERPGVVVLEQPVERTGPGGGYALTIADVDGRPVVLSADVAPAGPATHTPIVAPTKLSHLVVNSAVPDDYSRFLVDVLGFSLADEMPHMLFFRCNRDHHSLAVARAPHASLNHIAFEVPGVQDVRRGVAELADTVPMIWGPNRHGPGHNVFGYFVAPNDQVIEYTAEVEQIDEVAPPAPRMWLPEDSQLYDDWADAATLRPTAEAREVMLGRPEPALVAATTIEPSSGN